MTTICLLSQLKEDDCSAMAQLFPLEYRHKRKERLRALARAQIESLGNYFGDKKAELAYNEQGKPWIKSGLFQVSISYSDHLVATVGSEHCVGLDLEIRKSDPIAYLRLRKFFAKTDRLDWADPDAYLASFCLRESLLKAQGVGISDYKKIHIEDNCIYYRTQQQLLAVKNYLFCSDDLILTLCSCSAAVFFEFDPHTKEHKLFTKLTKVKAFDIKRIG